jgi:methylenetetrahydrofolate--tRNA-(uracil-5-)-methyltransferase
MPVEEMARRGRETLRFGPMKPVGLRDPRTGREAYAVAQLRMEDRGGRMWNIVGFQTRLRIPEQQRVFRMLPGLENAEFLRFGSIHRNAYVNFPASLSAHLSCVTIR